MVTHFAGNAARKVPAQPVWICKMQPNQELTTTTTNKTIRYFAVMDLEFLHEMENNNYTQEKKHLLLGPKYVTSAQPRLEPTVQNVANYGADCLYNPQLRYLAWLWKFRSTDFPRSAICWYIFVFLFTQILLIFRSEWQSRGPCPGDTYLTVDDSADAVRACVNMVSLCVCLELQNDLLVATSTWSKKPAAVVPNSDSDDSRAGRNQTSIMWNRHHHHHHCFLAIRNDDDSSDCKQFGKCIFQQQYTYTHHLYWSTHPLIIIHL